MRAWGKASPANGKQGFSPGCIYQNLTGVAGTSMWCNIGTFSSSQWINIDSPDGGLVTATATLTVTPLLHAGRTVLLSALAGFAVTIPAATGSGLIYRFSVLTVTTSNNYAISVPANTLFGNVVLGISASGGAADTFVATTGTGLTTITIDAAHQGGASMGDWLQFQDVATATWFCTGVLTGTTALATPFS